MPNDGRSISRKAAHLPILVHDVINLLYYEYWTDKQKYLYVQRYQVCNNWSKKVLFIIRTKLWCKKRIHKNDRLVLKTQQRFKSERRNGFTEEVNKITLSSNDAKRIQSIDPIKTYASRISQGIVSEKEENKCSNITEQYKND